ncbi:hypothetical protein C1N55_15495 [Lysinibacillus sp. SGAir0095]|nr:hypothetical protein C1N55_15495 [Lysinibacillus sp. SGAir0095]
MKNRNFKSRKLNRNIAIEFCIFSKTGKVTRNRLVKEDVILQVNKEVILIELTGAILEELCPFQQSDQIVGAK